LHKINCLAFGAHPDDVELSCSGLLIKLKWQGYTTGIINLTKGELGSNGTVDTRKSESKKAAEILNVDVLENLGMPDGNLENNIGNRLAIIKVVREYKPEIVLLPYREDRHPDHGAASRLVTDACFYAGLKKIETSQDCHRPKNLLYFMMYQTFEPTFIVDITDEMETKIESIKAYETQFGGNKEGGIETFINRPEFLENLINRAMYFGEKIGTRYGEPYYYNKFLRIDNIMEIFS